MTTKIGVVHHFFAHYRTGVIEELANCSAIDYTFYGDRNDYSPSGIPPADLPATVHFVKLSCLRLPFGFMWQKGLVSHCLRTSEDGIIFLGDVHYLATWLGALVLRFRRRRVWFWTHGWRRVDRSPLRQIRMAFYRLSDGLLLYGNNAVRIGLSLGYPRSRMRVIHNSLPSFPQTHNSHASASDTDPHDRKSFQRWIVIGRLTQNRRVGALLQELMELKQSGRSVSLTVVGDGSELDGLRDFANRHQLNVLFTGAVYDRETIHELLVSSDVAVFPGAGGLSIIESLSAGCPVATHDDTTIHGPEFEAIRSGRNGIVVPKGESGSLANAAWDFVAQADRWAVAQECVETVASNWSSVKQHEYIDTAVLSTLAIGSGAK